MSLLKAMMMGSGVPFQDEFKTVVYTGTGTERSITGVGFQPDLVWIKARSAANSHVLMDSIRGGNKVIFSDSTSAEVTQLYIESFDEDGFTLSAGVYGQTNQAGVTYVAWCWKAGGASSVNTEGSITSDVSAGKLMSIVGYTGTGANATIGHGLTNTPKMMIVKNLTTAQNWAVYHETNGVGVIWLNLTDGVQSVNPSIWNNTEPTSNVFTVGNGVQVNTLNEDYIAYCFAELPGVSDMGSYLGNGLADGPEIDCGFQPAYVMVKDSSLAGTNWFVWDNKRDTHNPNTLVLLPNSASVELSSASYSVDLTATGFKIRTTDNQLNANGHTYIYLAFAELPAESSPENRDQPLFNQIAYIGDGTSDHVIDGFGFKPDFVWLKDRTAANAGRVYDTLRGPGFEMQTSSTIANGFNVAGLSSFDSDGYTIGSSASQNGAGHNLIVWGWNAGGEAVPNTDGTIESTVMANVTGGFSIVTWTGNSVAGTTIGHGLGKKPKMIIVKDLPAAFNWPCYNETITATHRLYLNLTVVSATDASLWNNTEPDDALVTLGNSNEVNANTHDYIAYCWTDIPGISDMGSYLGNGSTTGTVVDCGFKPDWVMVKASNMGHGWLIFDSKRNSDNPRKTVLYAHLNNAENSFSTGMDFLDNGFQLREPTPDVNGVGGKYIYMAFKVEDRNDTIHTVDNGDLLLEGEVHPIVDTNATSVFSEVGTITVTDSIVACGTKSIAFGVGNHLSTPNSSLWELSTVDFTVDAWVNLSVFNAGIMGNVNGINTLGWGCFVDGNGFMRMFVPSQGGWVNIVSADSMNLDETTHVAWTRKDGITYAYMNGILLAQSALGNITHNPDSMSVGNTYSTRQPPWDVNGIIDQLRFTKGKALWTTTNFNLTDKGLYYPSGTLNI